MTIEWALAEWIGGVETISIDANARYWSASVVLGMQFFFTTFVLTTFDLWNPEWWRNYQLKSTSKIPIVTFKRILSMLPVMIRNYIVSAVYVWLLWNLRIAWSPDLPFWQHWSNQYNHSILFVALWGVCQLYTLHWISQLWFWSAHRLVHSWGPAFRFIHAAHHVHFEPFALTSIDCTVSEMLLLNIPAVIFPLLLIQPSLSMQYLWVILAALHVPLTHSGHHLFADAYHAIHHRELCYNFGSTTLDKMFGTYKQE